jgi:hypothetical protein
MAKQVVVRKAVGKHSIECVTVRQSILALTVACQRLGLLKATVKHVPRFFDEVDKVLLELDYE